MSDTKAPAAKVAEDELTVASSLLEAIRILRSDDAHYAAVTNPTKEQIEDLDAVIKGLRLTLDDGIDDAAGDETAFELAVALLWHADKSAITEGIQLMEYVLQERWAARWSAVMGSREAALPPHALVESVPDEDEAERPNCEEDDWVDTAAAADDAAALVGGYSAAWTSGTLRKSRGGVPVGTAIRGATAPPPPEAEGGSVLPSLTRGRAASSASAHPTLASSPSTSQGPISRQPTTGSVGTSRHSTSSYTSPGVDSSVCDTSASVASTTRADDQRLAKGYYHLAVGYTKLRKNDKAFFYAESALRLCPDDVDGRRLLRLLSARLYVARRLMMSVPLLAVGLLFL